ncbi:MAG TPA: hypothetical protein VD927_09770 [Chryseosolibacter sp.]|nr:hypothetical protein [Chryseosolibacter sp.]
MLQNRLDPSGNFIRTSARGALMGNRGVIHAGAEIVRPFKHKAWITCVLSFKGRQRTVMAPGRWTELFFLDEATAFAAGHRPCFECRREDANRFKGAWVAGNPAHQFSMKTSINAIDEILHKERIGKEHTKVTHQCQSLDLPSGTFILLNAQPYLVHNDRIHRWTPFGYEESLALPVAATLTVLTPESIVSAFRAGYVSNVGLPPDELNNCPQME